MVVLIVVHSLAAAASPSPVMAASQDGAAKPVPDEVTASAIGQGQLYPGPGVVAAPAAPSGITKVSPDNNPLPAFKWNAVSDAASYEVQMDAGAWSDIGNRLSWVQTTALSKGSHTISVRGKDASGTAGASATLTFQVSRTTDLANTRIAFDSYRDGNRDIYVMNADGYNQTRLTNDTAADEYPAWSPEGTRIAFVSRRDGNEQIYVMNADGSGQTRLTSNTATDTYPAWSPDGSKIAFTSSRDGVYEIYVMNADGSGQTRLTNNTVWDDNPAWSPDGNRLAFQSKQDGNFEIYVMNPDGSNQTRLTNNTADDEYPALVP